jgi:hypothetical protein
MILKKIKVSIVFIALLCGACSFFGNRDFRLRNRNLFMNNGNKIELNDYVNDDINIIRNGTDLFLISLDRSIMKISLKDKNIDWIKTINTIPQKNLVFDNDFIYFNGINNNFYILNYNTGVIEFIHLNTNQTTVFAAKKPLLYKNLIVAFFNNEVIIFNKNSKKILLHREYSNFNAVEIKDNVLTVNYEKINLDDYR